MKIRKRIIYFFKILCFLYFFTLIFFYIKQEKFFFNPKQLNKNYVFKFQEKFEELKINVDKNTNLSALLFKAQQSKGVILYLHGNAGAINDWGKRANLFLDNNYDVLFVDYRGYGKSDGSYSNSDQLFNDMQKVYNYVKTRYTENQITVLGFSLGSGLAAYIAANNQPKKLILNAPYYSWKTLIADEIAPPIPKFLIRYDIATYKFLNTVSCPIHIFHGTKDFLINPETNSIKLQKLYPNKIELTFIDDASHNSIHIAKQYYDSLKKLL
ncbi:peptidase [Flavivirga aquatica]|uniref:Peptidase n=1 Tax=Flavivirga aquatica TaxID=1849968 RepID=A0A1E5TCL8_9FLAO|nr:peptidase [Flavivirga aquatica]